MNARSLGVTGLLAIGALALGAAPSHADTFEFVTYKPPAGWKQSATADGIAFARETDRGAGLITMFASTASSATATDAFAAAWRARVKQGLGEQPAPDITKENGYDVAVGVTQVTAQGTEVTMALVVIVGNGRVLDTLAMTSGDVAFAEVSDFYDGIALSAAKPSTAPAPAPAPAATEPTGEIEVDFDVPAGYSSTTDAGMTVLVPDTVDATTPCTYAIGPARASRGSLAADAEAALLEPFAGWQVHHADRYDAERGTTATGWSYYWMRTELARLVEGSYEYANAMVMAFSGPGDQVNVLWGFGSNAYCMANDVAFSRLFHSLRPRGWKSDKGKALARELVGTWRMWAGENAMQYTFSSKGTFERGLHTVTTIGYLETTRTGITDGKYKLAGNELVLDEGKRGKRRVRVRVYEQLMTGRWTRTLAMLDESWDRPTEVEYMHVGE